MPEIPHTSTDDIKRVAAVVDNPIFTDVTEDGERYTTYRIVRISHTFASHPSGWTHIVVVAPLRSVGLFEAFLEVRRRVVERSVIRCRIEQEKD